MSDRTYTMVTINGKRIRADYSGGAYIDLTFGSEGYRPTEVINVYDHAKGEPEPPFNRWETMENLEAKGAIRDAVKEWAKSNEEDGWDSWYEDYLANAGV